MTGLASRFAAEAEQMVGLRFRLHGRNPDTGLDCIGLASCALEQAGATVQPPAGYSLRNLEIAPHLDAAARSGFRVAEGVPQRGDLLLVRPGPSQHHLVIALGQDRFVHAHAGLRRVVLHSGLCGWPIVKHWRLATHTG